MSQTLPAVGEVFEVRYPFVRDTYEELDYDEKGISSTTRLTWKPGIVSVGTAAPDGDPENIAHGLGSMRLTVVGVYQPGRFPTRVFFTRKWTDPDGREFGEGKCHIATIEKFRRISQRFQVDYELRPQRALPAFQEGQ